MAAPLTFTDADHRLIMRQVTLLLRIMRSLTDLFRCRSSAAVRVLAAETFGGPADGSAEGRSASRT
jgi:hypothetical protein